MLVSGDDRLALLVRSLRDHGSDIYDGQQTRGLSGINVSRAGFNYRLTDIQAALGLAQLDRLNELLAQRQRVAKFYRARLAGLAGVILPSEPAGYEHAYHSFVLLVCDNQGRMAKLAAAGLLDQKRAELLPLVDDLRRRRDMIIARLIWQNIQTKPASHAIHRLEYYHRAIGARDEDLPGSCIAEAAGLVLPLYPSLTEQEQERVCVALGAALAPGAR